MIHRDASRDASGNDTERPFIAGEPRRHSARAGREHALRPREAAPSPARCSSGSASSSWHSGGTLFLDEIGDLQFDLQAKLLRAIQEGEIERVGGGKPIKSQFRLIAATNVDLEQAVKRGHVPRRPLLPLQRHPGPPPAAARAARGPARPGAVLPAPLQHAVPERTCRASPTLDAADAAALLVAGQHPRAREPGRAAGGHRATATGSPTTTCRSSCRSPDLDRAERRGAACSTARWPPSSATSSSARSSAAAGTSRRPRATSAVPLSTLKFKIDRLEIKDIARRIRGSA